jgi:hypothetical protein
MAFCWGWILLILSYVSRPLKKRRSHKANRYSQMVPGAIVVSNPLSMLHRHTLIFPGMVVNHPPQGF